MIIQILIKIWLGLVHHFHGRTFSHLTSWLHVSPLFGANLFYLFLNNRQITSLSLESEFLSWRWGSFTRICIFNVLLVTIDILSILTWCYILKGILFVSRRKYPCLQTWLIFPLLEESTYSFYEILMTTILHHFLHCFIISYRIRSNIKIWLLQFIFQAYAKLFLFSQLFVNFFCIADLIACFGNALVIVLEINRFHKLFFRDLGSLLHPADRLQICRW